MAEGEEEKKIRAEGEEAKVRPFPPLFRHVPESMRDVEAKRKRFSQRRKPHLLCPKRFSSPASAHMWLSELPECARLLLLLIGGMEGRRPPSSAVLTDSQVSAPSSSSSVEPGRQGR